MLAPQVLLSPSSGMVKDSKASRKPDPLPDAYSSYNGTTKLQWDHSSYNVTTTANNGTTAANNETTTASNGTTAANNGNTAGDNETTTANNGTTAANNETTTANNGTTTANSTT